MSDNKDIFQELYEHLESEEGQRSLQEYFDRINAQEKRKETWVNKIISMIEGMSDDEQHNLLMRFIEWEGRYEEMWYTKRHTQTCSRLFGVVELVFEKLGEEFESNEMFFSHGYKYKDYVIETYCGQGCFSVILKDGERIFTGT